MTRVLHTGDTHLGYQQYHSPERREDFRRAFRRVVEDAVADGVDAVVHAGDLFHDRRPGLPDLLATIETLEELRAAGVPFLAVVGNHEGTRGEQWLDLLESLGLATRLGREPVVVGDVALYGQDFVPRSRREDLEYDFEAHDAEHAALVAHGLFEPFAHADWDTEALLERASVDFDAMLLGDNHHPDRAEVAGTWVTYCGSTERTSAEEREQRGYNLVTFEDGEVRIARRGLETREFVFVDVELGEDEGQGRVRERVLEEDLEDAVVVVTVTGDGDAVVPAEVERAADGAGALVTRVHDHREREESEADYDVQFADPDRAVDERLRSMGLSEAAREIDRTVRDGELADANVRSTVEDRVRELLEASPEALEPAPADERSSEGERTGESDPDEDPAGDQGDAHGEPAGGEGSPDAGVESTEATTEGAQSGDDDQVTMEDFL